jgi:hypothetical protein
MIDIKIGCSYIPSNLFNSDKAEVPFFVLFKFHTLLLRYSIFSIQVNII